MEKNTERRCTAAANNNKNHNSTELPKELLSTVTLTTHHLLPTTTKVSPTTHRSHLEEHPPDYYCGAAPCAPQNTEKNSDSSSSISCRISRSSHTSNYCHNDENWKYSCASSFSSSSVPFIKYNKDKHKILKKDNGTARIKSFGGDTSAKTTTAATATMFISSSPAFEVSHHYHQQDQKNHQRHRHHHRRNECNRSKNNSNMGESSNTYTSNFTLKTLANTLRQLLTRLHSTATTANTTTSGTTKSSLTKTTRTVRCKSTSPALSAKRTVSTRTRFRLLPSLGATSFFTLLTLVCLETILLSTVSNCAKTFYMHWNTSNSIFRIDNTDHIIDVNKGNLAFEFDQVHIICPVYEPGTFENETEKYIIYNVSKVEYETCRITNADPRVIAICDKPQKLMFFTITFRPFTPQPGGLEFLPGNDYYFISTSSKDDLYRRIGGRCSTNNMKVVFKVCCAPEEKNKTTTTSLINTASGHGGGGNTGTGDSIASGGAVGVENANIDINAPTNNVNQHHNSHMNNINTIGINGINSGLMPVGGGGGVGNNNNGIGVQLHPINNGGPSGTSINTNIDQFNRIPIQTNGINVIGNNIGGGVGLGSHGVSGIMLTPGHGGINMIPNGVGGGGVQYPGHHPGQSGIRINNVPSQQHYPSHKNNNNNNDDHFDKHPNEVVKNEELTYNSGATINRRWSWKTTVANLDSFIAAQTLTAADSDCNSCSNISRIFKHIVNKIFYYDQLGLNLNMKILDVSSRIISSFNPIILLSILLISITHYILKSTLSSSMLSLSLSSSSLKSSQNCHTSESAKSSSYQPVKHRKTNENVSINFR